MRAFVTAVYGAFDRVKSVPWGAPGFLFTDSVETADEAERQGWHAIVRAFPDEHPRMSSKRPKWQPLEFLPDYPVQVWMDGSMHPMADCIEAFDYGPWAMFKHPFRNDISEEAEVSTMMAKYAGQDPMWQARTYKQDGWPDHWGLWENGFHVRDMTAPGMVELFDDIWAEVQRWGYQCQIATAYCCWRRGMRPTEMPGISTANRFILLAGHEREV